MTPDPKSLAFIEERRILRAQLTSFYNKLKENPEGKGEEIVQNFEKFCYIKISYGRLIKRIETFKKEYQLLADEVSMDGDEEYREKIEELSNWFGGKCRMVLREPEPEEMKKDDDGDKSDDDDGHNEEDEEDEADVTMVREQLEKHEETMALMKEEMDNLRKDLKLKGTSSKTLGGTGQPKRFDLKRLQLLEKFDGKYESFGRFWRMFDAVVDSTDAVDEEKHATLIKHLDEGTRKLIKGLSGTQYTKAKDRLVKFFTNRHASQVDIIERIKASKPIYDERNLEAFREMVGLIVDTYESLKHINAARDFVNYTYYQEITAKLPFRLIRDFTNQYKTKQPVEKLISFLEERVEQLEFEAEILMSRAEQKKEAKVNNKGNKYNRAQVNQIGQDPAVPKCPFCEGKHKGFLCDSKQTPQQREEIRKRKGLCAVCCYANHQTRNCRSPYRCRKCKGLHSEVLCFKAGVPVAKPGVNKLELPENDIFSIDPEVYRMELSQPLIPPIYVKVKILEHIIRGFYDPGANVNVISKGLCRKWDVDFTHKAEKFTQFVDPGKFIGFVVIQTQIGAIQRPVLFRVIDIDADLLLIGRAVILEFQLEQDKNLEVHQVLDADRVRVSYETSQEPNEPQCCQIEVKPELDLPEESEEELKALMEEFDRIFSQFKGEVGRITTEKCHIRLTSKIPVTLRPYKCTAEDQKTIDEQLQKLLDQGLIEESDSPYAFPIVLVFKKDGTIKIKSRLCIDYRRLNLLVEPESYPFPRITDITERLLNAKYFTTLDITSGYHHIEIAQEDRHVTSFVTMNDQFQWIVMPMGYKNAGPIFQRAVYRILKKHGLCAFTSNYLDDMICFSRNLKEHLFHLRLIFQALLEENVKLNRAKCSFAKREVEYLGHLISHNEIRPQNSNVKAIIDFPAPTTVKQLKGFLGKINFYHRFIPGRGSLLDPLYNLTKKNVQYAWNDEAQKAFEVVKVILTTPPVLCIFDPAKETIMITDASYIATAAILKQKQGCGTFLPIGYMSKRLLPYQRNYAVTEVECLAIVQGLDYWHFYLFGIEFVIYTDHSPLQWIGKAKQHNSRLLNWALRLNQYRFTIKYKPGKENQEADCLSRSIAELSVCVITWEEAKQIQESYEGPTPSGCIVENGLVQRVKGDTKKIFLPEEDAVAILKRIHREFGHIGTAQMNFHFSIRYYTPALAEKLKRVALGCETCVRVKENRRPAGKMGHLGPAHEPFEIIHVDTVGGFSHYNSKKKFWHLAIDGLTRYAWGMTSKSQTAKDFVNLIQKICEMDQPKVVVSDKYTGLRSKEFRKFLYYKGIEITYTPTDKSSANGLVERLNQTVLERMRCKRYDNDRRISWTTLANEVIQEYNRTIHTVTKFPPAYLMIGLDNEGLFEGSNLEQNRDKAFENSQEGHSRNAKRHDQKHKEMILVPGDRVFLKTGSDIARGKLDPLFEGPFEVLRRVSNTIYKIQRGLTKELVHVAKLKSAKYLEGQEAPAEQEGAPQIGLGEEQPVSPPEPEQEEAQPCQEEVESPAPNPAQGPTTRSKTKGCSKWNAMITLAMVISLFSTADAQNPPFEKVQPIVWRKTKHGIAHRSVYGTVVMELESPCSVLLVETEDQMRTYMDCQRLYEETVLKRMQQSCPPYEDFELHKPKNQKSGGRNKRGLLMGLAAGFAVVLVVVTVVFGVTMAVFHPHQSDEKIEKLNEEFLEKMAVIKREMDVSLAIHKKLEELASSMIFSMEEHYNRTEASLRNYEKAMAAISKLNTVDGQLSNFLEELSEGRISREYHYLFPNLTLCENCPRRFWESAGCGQLPDGRFVLKITAVETSTEMQILRADAFRLASRSKVDPAKICYHRYTGDKYIVHDVKRNCTRDLDWEPSQEAEVHFLFDKDICDVHLNRTEVWRDITCHLQDEQTPSRIVQKKTDEEYQYVYCFQQDIQVDSMHPVNCTNDIYRLGHEAQVTINGIEIPVGRRDVETGLNLNPHVNRAINEKIFPQITNQRDTFHELERLITAEEDGNRNWHEHAVVVQRSMDIYLIGGILVAVMVISMVMTWRKKIFRCYEAKVVNPKVDGRTKQFADDEDTEASPVTTHQTSASTNVKSMVESEVFDEQL